jgi:hypothetical protein
MKERIPKEGGEDDLRFVERNGVKILQWRRSIVAPKQPPEAKITGVPVLIWSPWEDVRVEKEEGG